MTPESAWKPPHQASTEQPVKKKKKKEENSLRLHQIFYPLGFVHKISLEAPKKKKKAVVIGS